MAEGSRLLVVEPGTDMESSAPASKASVAADARAHCGQYRNRYCLGFCCLICGIPLLIFALSAAIGALSSTPPTVPPVVLELLLAPYMQPLPEEYPAVALASSGAAERGLDIPAEATPYDVCLEPRHSAYQGLPDAGEVFDKIFARREFVKEEFGFNLLHCTFVNFFLEDFFRTINSTNGSWANRGTGLLSQVYGTDDARTEALRTHEGGKMRIADDGRLPHWKDIVKDHPALSVRCHHLPGYSHNEACQATSSWYACGDERCNTHPGFIFWSTAFVLHHNYLCDMLAQNHPHMSDDELFETARDINRFSMFKPIWEEYVFKMTCGKDACSVPLDVDYFRDVGFPRFSAGHPELGFTSIPLEFNQLYQWHFWIPDDIWWEDEGKSSTPFVDLMWSPDAFKARSLQDWADAFHRTPMGHIQPRNYPTWMKRTFLKNLNFSRANNLAPYNDYREFFNLPRYTSWDQFDAGPEVTEELKQLYGGDIDRVEFQVGLWADAAEDPVYVKLGLIHPLPKALKRMVGTFALTCVVNTPLVKDPNFLSPEHLTIEGVDYAKAVTLEKLLENSGIRGLGSAPNEVPGSWRPSGATTATLHGVMGLARVFR